MCDSAGMTVSRTCAIPSSIIDGCALIKVERANTAHLLRPEVTPRLGATGQCHAAPVSARWQVPMSRRSCQRKASLLPGAGASRSPLDHASPPFLSSHGERDVDDQMLLPVYQPMPTDVHQQGPAG